MVHKKHENHGDNSGQKEKKTISVRQNETSIKTYIHASGLSVTLFHFCVINTLLDTVVGSHWLISF